MRQAKGFALFWPQMPHSDSHYTVTDTVFTVDLGDGSVLYIFGPCTRHVDCSLMQVSEQERDGRSE